MNTHNRVGLPAQTLRTQLYSRGSHLCLREGKGPQSADAVVVGRHEDGWKPVGLAEVQACFQQGNPSTELGLWRDQRRWVVFPADGQIQSHEVQPMSDRWEESRLAQSQTLQRRGQRESQYVLHFAQVDGAQVGLEGSQLVEPRTVCRSELHTASGWDYSRRVGHYATAWKTETWGK